MLPRRQERQLREPRAAADTGRKAIDVCTAKLHWQPELASGMSSRPEAGIMLIQQPGLLIFVTLSCTPRERSKKEADPSLKKRFEREAETFPQPPRLPLFHFQPLKGFPLRSS